MRQKRPKSCWSLTLQTWVLSWAEQADVEKPPKFIWDTCAVSLRCVAKNTKLGENELAEFVVWWWRWKVPNLKEMGAEPVFAPNPQRAASSVGEFRYWRQRCRTAIDTEGIENYCLRRAVPVDKAWTAPESWTNPLEQPDE